MLLRKLDPSFYLENSHLIEALDNYNGNWGKGKTRGYGIAVVTMANLKFAIPLRSHINHNAAYITVKSQPHGHHGKGLDFTKALLLIDNKYVSSEVYKIPYDEKKKLASKSRYIIVKFEKYVEKYIYSVKTSDNNILTSNEYRYSTLVNYHKELKIQPTYSDVFLKN